MQRSRGRTEVLVFQHPVAGTQLVKGTLEKGEDPMAGALRELSEESGLRALAARPLGSCPIGRDGVIWSFWLCEVTAPGAGWSHQTLDDHGHVFRFHWHDMGTPDPADMHADFRAALAFLRPLLRSVS